MRRSILVAWICGIALVCGVGVVAALVPLSGKPSVATQPAIALGGPFRLTGPEGAAVDSQQQGGKPFGVFFGFTHCPDVCPTTVSELTEAFQILGPIAKDFKVFFISVDPGRDTPEVLKSYFSSFDDRIIGLTGSEAEIAAVAKLYRAYYKRVPLDGGDYTMDHTAGVYLMDGKGHFVSLVNYQDSIDLIVKRIRAVIEGKA